MAKPTLMLALLVAQGVAGAAQDVETEDFLALETQLMSAAQLKDQAGMEPLVSDEFAYSLALEDRANYVLNRSEWFKGSRYYNLKEFQISQLTAHVFPRAAITNFRLVTSAEGGDSVDRSGSYVVTDVWTGGKGRWKLVRRFVSRPATPTAAP
jgi:hypothetical protein